MTSGGYSLSQWAGDVLRALGAPVTQNNVTFLVSWAIAEGGDQTNSASFNPLNTTWTIAGSTPLPGNAAVNNGVAVQQYPDYSTGLQATVNTLKNGRNNNLIQMLQQGGADPQAMANTVVQDGWGTNGFSGTQGSNQVNLAAAQGGFQGGGSNSAAPDPNNSAFLPVTPQPQLSLDMLRAEAPLVAAIVTSVPELQTIFNSAVSQSWSVDKFIAAIQNSKWWQTTSDSARQAFALMKSDPATWNQNVDNLQASLFNTAALLGATLTQAQANAIAVDAITNGYSNNDAMIRAKMEQYVQPVSGVHFGGEAGTDETTLRQGLRDMGLFIPEQDLQGMIRDIIGGKTTVQAALAGYRTMAQSAFPAYTAMIQQGQNVSDIAAPFIARGQQLLEQGPGQMNIYSPQIQSALKYVDPKTGKPTPMPMFQFENALRKDPAWLGTDNAQDSFMSVAHQVLTNFGFVY